MESLYRYTVPLVPADSLYQEMQSNQVVLLDIRSEAEFAVSHLTNAQLVPYEGFSARMVEDLSRQTPIVVYCSVGYRSERIGEQLQKMGFTSVRNLYGGIFDWKNKGYPVVNAQNVPTDSVHTYNKNWSQWLNKGTKVYD